MTSTKKKTSTANSTICTCQISDICKKRNGENKISNFYMSNSDLYKGIGVLPVCKDCLKVLYEEYNKKYRDERLALYKFCERVDIPYYEAAYIGAKNKAVKVGWLLHQAYFTQINSFKDANGYGDCFDNGEELNNISDENISNGIVDGQIIIRWGSNWRDEDYYKLEEFYHSMKRANKIETPQEEDYLKKLARLSIKIDEAIENGDSGKAKQMGDLYSKYMTDSKFRAMDMTDADKSGGIRTFGQIYSEVEKDDFIPPWTKYMKIKGLTQDIVDKTIMHIENFTLRFGKAERMSEPPNDTPKANVLEIDDGDTNV